MNKDLQYANHDQPNDVFYIHRFFTSSILIFIFYLAYILAPYWRLSPSTLTTCVLFIITTGFGFLWSYWASNHFQIRINKNVWFTFVILFFIIGLLNYRALTSVIPWRGDEEYHILVTLQLVDLIPFGWIITFVLLFSFLGLSGWYRLKWLFITSIFSPTTAYSYLSRFQS